MCFFDPLASFFRRLRFHCFYSVYFVGFCWSALPLRGFFNKRSRFTSFYVRCSRFCFLSLCSNRWVALTFSFFHVFCVSLIRLRLFSGVCGFIVFIPFISWDFVEALCLYVAFFNKRVQIYFVLCALFPFLLFVPLFKSLGSTYF